VKKYFSEFGESPTPIKGQEDNAEPRLTDIACLAGIFDGEGSIIFNIMKKRNEVYIGFHITNFDILLLNKCRRIFQEILNRQIKLYKKKIYSKSTVKSNLDCFTIDFRRREDVYKVLNLLVPYLTSKLEKARIVLEYLKYRINEIKILGKSNYMPKRTKDKVKELISRYSGVTTERKALYSIEMKPQSDLYSNIENGAEMTSSYQDN